MSGVRVIARLDIKAPNLVKGVHLEGLRIMGDPCEHASTYYKAGADEIMYQDIVASLYGRNNIMDLVSKTASNVFIPMTIGGGIRTIDDAKVALRSGGDKVALNTAATKRPELIKDLADTFGSQCVVVAIEAIRGTDGNYGVFTDNGRENTPWEVISWAREAQAQGAGEILLTSVDKEGTFQGFDYDLIRKVRDVVDIPLIAHGGAGSPEDVVEVVSACDVDAVAIAGILHYERHSILEIKQALADAGYEVRL